MGKKIVNDRLLSQNKLKTIAKDIKRRDKFDELVTDQE
jgi:hypothetical protein